MILVIGLANLTDILTGVSPQIILNSKSYRYFSYMLLFYMFLIVLTNYIFIPVFGIIGAAIATMVSKAIFNFVKFIFLYRKYKLQPFTFKTVLLYLIGIVAYAVSLLLPEFSNYVIDIVVRSAVITTVFIIPVYYFNISEDINSRINEALRRFGK